MSFDKILTIEQLIDIINRYSNDLWLTVDCAGIAQLEGLIDSSSFTYQENRKLLSFKMGNCIQSIALNKATYIYLLRIVYCGYDVVEILISFDDFDSTLHFMFDEKNFNDQFEYIKQTYL